MGKRARNRRREHGAQPWEGIGGRNPLTLAPEALASHVPQALEHIVAVGFSNDGRPSLAGCWLMGEQMIAEAVNAEVAPDWAGEAHPLVVAYLGATADPQVLSLPLEALTAGADGWAEALDAAGATTACAPSPTPSTGSRATATRTATGSTRRWPWSLRVAP